MSITNTAKYKYQFKNLDYEESASVTVQKEDFPVVTIVKESNVDIVYPGDVITYKVTIYISEFNGALTMQEFSDLIPSELEFVEGSITVDAEPYEGNISSIPLDFEPNSSHLIMYQCRVL